MQSKALVLIASCALTLGCEGAEESGAPRKVCAIEKPHWRTPAIDPPSQVLVWRITAQAGGVMLNGKQIRAAELIEAIKESKNYRPSPYVFVSDLREKPCDAAKLMLERIDEAFDCRLNYCFYEF